MPRLVLAAAVVACLAPFLGKPFHIDDPMYIWAAQHIARDPLHFYGFDVNWYGYFAPMYELNKNPPLVSFYLALIGVLFGWSEPALHAGMMLPALAAVLGTHALARRLCGAPVLAALACWVTPALLVSATTVMSDVLMLALWCWAAATWIGGLETGSRAQLALAAVLAGLCPLAKYFGLALLPLLFLYAVMRERRLGSWAVFFLIPLAIVGLYQLVMRWLHGWDPLADVASYALTIEVKQETYALAERGLVGVSFLGGCLLTTLFFAPLLWSARTLLLGALAAAAAAAALFFLGTVGPLALTTDAGARWDLIAQLVVFLLAGVQVLAFAVRDLAARRSPDAWFLALWLLGVWFFASFTNWTTTARAILPAAPAAAVLLVRNLERARTGLRIPLHWPRVAAPLAAGLALSLAVAWADTALAVSARTAAETLSQKYDGGRGRLYFQGAWGFQQYMQAAGGTRLDLNAVTLNLGDVVITPANNTNLIILPPQAVYEVESIELPAGRGLTTLSLARGAGFYAALYGPLPYTFGPVPLEKYTVARIVTPIKFHP
jgi:4-amino-4-deoxy-L-arabinose transferase-like glycosyltransferase